MGYNNLTSVRLVLAACACVYQRLPQKLVRGHSNWFCARQISPDIGNLTGIEQIGLQGNMLTSMPDEFGQLVRLQRMCVRRLSLH